MCKYLCQCHHHFPIYFCVNITVIELSTKADFPEMRKILLYVLTHFYLYSDINHLSWFKRFSRNFFILGIYLSFYMLSHFCIGLNSSHIQHLIFMGLRWKFCCSKNVILLLMIFSDEDVMYALHFSQDEGLQTDNICWNMQHVCLSACIAGTCISLIFDGKCLMCLFHLIEMSKNRQHIL